MAMEKFSDEYVKYLFNEEEKREIASEMARKVSEHGQAEDDKKAIMADLKSRIDGLQAQINSSATKLNNGYEMRTVKCHVVPDYAMRVWRIYRLDTDEMVREKRMAADDLQMRLDEVGDNSPEPEFEEENA
jgi:hypothetical protein